MKIKLIALLALITLTCSACKVLKTHVVKLTSSAEMQNDAVLLKTTKGYKIELSDKPFTGAKSLVTELENGYNQFNNPIMLLLQDLYLLIFKDRDSQTALGRGYVDGNSDFINTGGTNGKGYIYGETTGKIQMCFLGIEDLWGNKRQWVDGLVSDGSYNILTGTK